MGPPRFSFSVPIDAILLDSLLVALNRSWFKGRWFVSAIATADAIDSLSCAGVVGMSRVSSVTVLATTFNVDDNEDNE